MEYLVGRLMTYDGLALVTGASGNLGRRVVQRLQRSNIPVRGLVRTPVKGEALEATGATMCVGDMTVPADMRRAVNGVRAIISTAGIGLARGSDSPMRVDYEGNLNLINAAVAAGVEHFVLISAIGANWIHSSDIFVAKNKAEQELRSSSLRYSILRAAGFMSDYRQARERVGRRGVYVTIGRAGKRLSVISPDDLAELAVRSLWTPGAFNKTFDVANSETDLSAERLAATFSAVFDKPIRVRRLPVWPFKTLRLVLNPVLPGVADFMGFLAAVGSHDFTGDGERVERVYGYRLERYEEFLRRTCEGGGKGG